MPSIRKKRLPHRELLKRLKEYGVVVIPHRGKGSEEILGFKSGMGPNGKYSGPSIPIGTHGKSKEHSPSVVDTVLSTFGISEEVFWKE